MAMIFEKRYLPDYKYEETYDPVKQKITTTATYIGPYFNFEEEKKARVTAAWLFGGALAAWICFFMAVSMLNAASEWAWVILPYLLILIPLWYVTNRLFTAMRVKEPLDHRDSDRVTLFQYGTIPGMILAGGSGISEAVSMILIPHKVLSGDWVFLGCVAAVFAYFLILHLKKKDMNTVPITNG